MEYFNSIGGFFAQFDPTNPGSVASNITTNLDPTLKGSAANRGIQGAKTVTLAPARGAFLEMLNLNIWNLAKRVGDIKASNPAKYESIKKWWYGLGGDRTKFDKAVETGKNKPKLIEKIAGKLKFEGEYFNMAAATSAAIITAGSGIAIALITKFLGGKQGMGSDLPEGGYEQLEELQRLQQNTGGMSKNTKIALIIGGSVVAVGLIIFIIYQIRKK